MESRLDYEVSRDADQYDYEEDGDEEYDDEEEYERGGYDDESIYTEDYDEESVYYEEPNRDDLKKVYIIGSGNNPNYPRVNYRRNLVSYASRSIPMFISETPERD